MPAWLHNRADHIRAKNPSMPKSEAFAIATQQSHATGHTPSGYGTAEGKRKAKQKYDKPKSEYEQTANPKSKSSSISLTTLKGFNDELSKIASLKPKMATKKYQKHPDVPPASPPPPANSLLPAPATAAGSYI